MADVRVIGRAPHPTGSAEDAAVRAYLVARLQSMGLEVATATGAMDAAGAETARGLEQVERNAAADQHRRDTARARPRGCPRCC